MYKKEHDKVFLVVDNHPHIRKTIKDNLEKMGITNVVEAEGGKQALDILHDIKVDYILAGWKMHEYSGLELLIDIRNNPRIHSIPFIMITAETNRKCIENALKAGSDDFLIKPFSSANFKKKIDKLLKRNKHVDFSRLERDQVEKEVSAERPKVLVVDDTPTNIDIVSGLLKDDYKVIAVTNGQKALTTAVKEPYPDLILLDIMMPEMDGLEVCKRLKNNPLISHIPIIFLSAKKDVEDVVKGLALGAVDYISKPVNPDILKARVKTHISLKQRSDELREQVDTIMENVKLREDVARITAHDLKSPLSAIVGASGLLYDNRELPDGDKQLVKMIQEGAYNMLGMIDSSLDLYKIETGQYEFNAVPVDISAVALKVVEQSRIDAAYLEITVQFETEESMYILGEELLCFSMLSNLIKNAVEASPRSNSVTVTIFSSNGGIQILIHNVGVVPEEIRDIFFEKYITAGKTKGTGLGTYSAKLITEIQGGTISFESSIEDGTTVLIGFDALHLSE